MPNTKDWLVWRAEIDQKIANLMTFQKWQMGLLTLIFLAALKAAIH